MANEIHYEKPGTNSTWVVAEDGAWGTDELIDDLFLKVFMHL